MGAAAALLPLLAVLLAGCSGDGGGKAGNGPSPADVDPGSTVLGAISGVVVDDAIRPIPDAKIVLADQGRDVEAVTDAEGLFSFTDLQPGFYAMSASARLYLPTQATADVVAGETAKVKVQLLRDPTPQPYHITLKHDGFMQAWGTIAQFEVENLQESGACDCRIYFQPDPDPTTFIVEATWEESVPNPAGPSEFYWIVEEPADVEGDMYEADYCTSPCYTDVSAGGSAYQGGQVMVRLDGPDEWVEVQQPFTLFVTTWYNGEPPQGWSVVNGDV